MRECTPSCTLVECGSWGHVAVNESGERERAVKRMPNEDADNKARVFSICGAFTLFNAYSANAANVI